MVLLRPPLRVVNVGGSLQSALFLSAVAWSIRLLRARHALNPEERPPKPAVRVSSRAQYGRLSPLAFRALLELQPFPFTLVDVRTAEEAAARPVESFLEGPLSGAAAAATVQLPEAELPPLLRPGGEAWSARFGAPAPSARRSLVFLCAAGPCAARCASLAATLGFLRCAVLEGGLGALAEAPPPLPLLETLSRHALAQLLERGAAGGRRLGEEGGPLLLDVRRCDEHSLYGALPGAAHLPAEQLPRALAMAADEWARTFRFPQPRPGAACVLYSRGECRARWAALLLSEAGLGRCLLLREGAAGWRLDTCVKRYSPYAEGAPPPAPEPFALEEADASDGDEELYALDLL